jgi:RNA polymerase sigma-70 factor (ECF subfamily)
VEDANWLTKRFEEHRTHLRGVAYRMLGSLGEADDAVQEAWLRLNRADASGIDNLGGWLTTIVGRVCLDMLRSRKSRREQPLDAQAPEPGPSHAHVPSPENEALLADAVGVALLVVLDRLTPHERLAFVLHDLFAVPFDEIAPIVGRSPTAARQLASRARRRVQGADAVPDAELTEQREVINAFLKALRSGDFDALVAVLDPDFTIQSDAVAAPPVGSEVRGAQAWARQALTYSRGARFAQPALINGALGVIVAPRGKLMRALRFTMHAGKVVSIEVIGEPARLQELDVAVLQTPPHA